MNRELQATNVSAHQPFDGLRANGLIQRFPIFIFVSFVFFVDTVLHLK